MKNFLHFFWALLKGLFILIILAGIGWGTWLIGLHFAWDWGSFWSNFISNTASSAVIGFVLYWIVTRPDEKRANQQRRDQALGMLKNEFKVNLERAKRYQEALKNPQKDLSPFYPLRFTRGAWNALRESGFFPQFDDMEFVYRLLRVNEVIMVANSSLSSVRSAKAGKNMKSKLNHYAKKAAKECAQIEEYLLPVLATLNTMRLPEIAIHQDVTDEGNEDEDDIEDNDDEK